MPSTTTFFTALAGVLALAALYVYLFGIPPQWKRAMEDKALETMGENKASYMMKSESPRVHHANDSTNIFIRPNQQSASIRPTGC